MIENIQPKGLFRLLVFDTKTDHLLETYENRNLVVASGKTNLAKLLGGDTSAGKVTQIAFGTNGATPTASDTAITNQFAKAIDGVSYPATNQVQFSWTLNADEANGIDIQELGLLTASGTLFARKVRTTISKTSAIRLVGTWTISIL